MVTIKSYCVYGQEQEIKENIKADVSLVETLMKFVSCYIRNDI